MNKKYYLTMLTIFLLLFTSLKNVSAGLVSHNYQFTLINDLVLGSKVHPLDVKIHLMKGGLLCKSGNCKRIEPHQSAVYIVTPDKDNHYSEVHLMVSQEWIEQNCVEGFNCDCTYIGEYTQIPKPMGVPITVDLSLSKVINGKLSCHSDG